MTKRDRQHRDARGRVPEPPTKRENDTVGSPPSAPPPSILDGQVVSKLCQSDSVQARRIQQRRRNVMFGKNTVGYHEYIRQVPKHKRKPRCMEHPMTPDHTVDIPNRRWRGLVKAWRIALHKYDPPDLQTAKAKKGKEMEGETKDSKPAATKEGGDEKKASAEERSIQAKQIIEATSKGMVVDFAASAEQSSASPAAAADLPSPGKDTFDEEEERHNPNSKPSQRRTMDKIPATASAVPLRGGCSPFPPSAAVPQPAAATTNLVPVGRLREDFLSAPAQIVRPYTAATRDGCSPPPPRPPAAVYHFNVATANLVPVGPYTAATNFDPSRPQVAGGVHTAQWSSAHLYQHWHQYSYQNFIEQQRACGPHIAWAPPREMTPEEVKQAVADIGRVLDSTCDAPEERGERRTSKQGSSSNKPGDRKRCREEGGSRSHSNNGKSIELCSSGPLQGAGSGKPSLSHVLKKARASDDVGRSCKNGRGEERGTRKSPPGGVGKLRGKDEDRDVKDDQWSWVAEAFGPAASSSEADTNLASQNVVGAAGTADGSAGDDECNWADVWKSIRANTANVKKSLQQSHQGLPAGTNAGAIRPREVSGRKSQRQQKNMEKKSYLEQSKLVRQSRNGCAAITSREISGRKPQSEIEQQRVCNPHIDRTPREMASEEIKREVADTSTERTDDKTVEGTTPKEAKLAVADKSTERAEDKTVEKDSVRSFVDRSVSRTSECMPPSPPERVDPPSLSARPAQKPARTANQSSKTQESPCRRWTLLPTRAAAKDSAPYKGTGGRTEPLKKTRERDYFRERLENAADEQEELLRKAAERARSQLKCWTKGPGRSHLHRAVFSRPLKDLSTLPPEHWKWPDPYARLGLPPGSGPALVKKHFRKLALLCHPDKLHDDSGDALDRFHAVKEAADMLLKKNP